MLGAIALCVAIVLATIDAAGQGRGRGQAGPPQTARQAAPLDLTGTWVSVVTEDWRWRMVTPPKGDVASIPVTPEGRKAAQGWDLAADNASGNQCKAFGVGGIMRQPGRLRISWQDDQTLKLEFDAGTQTRLLNFDRDEGSRRPRRAGRDSQSRSGRVPAWGAVLRPTDPRATGGGLLSRGVPGGGGQGLRGGPPPRQQNEINSGGHVKVVTTNFREGYLRKNGVPYSEQASITEYIQRLPTHPNGDSWLHVLTMIDDPKYLNGTFYTSTNFRLEPDGSKFNPSACKTDPPLPVKG